MIFAVLDTNVIVSALYAKKEESMPLRAVKYIYTENVIPVYDYEILKEYDQVLRRDKFKFPEDRIKDIIKSIVERGILVKEVLFVDEEGFPDKSDIKFYRVTMTLKGEGAYLVTGNAKHFPKEEFIVSPREFVEIVQKDIEEEKARKEKEQQDREESLEEKIKRYKAGI